MMQTKVNLRLLGTTDFDSGALGMMAMVIHQFPKPGNYVATILETGRERTEVEFNVDEGASAMQLDIDLAETVRKAGRNDKESCCRRSTGLVPRAVSPKGYVLFHASAGSGFSVRVAQRDEKPVFDSAKLSNGDLFAVTLLQPGDYAMKNLPGKFAGEIVVKAPTEKIKDLRNLEATYVDVGAKGFGPAKIELTSTQGLVFRIKDAARIQIARKGGELREPIKKPQPKKPAPRPKGRTSGGKGGRG